MIQPSRRKLDLNIVNYFKFAHGFRWGAGGVLESAGNVTTLPPRELFMTKREKDLPMVATYRAKWDESYREKWGISTGKAAKVSRESLELLSNQSIKMFRALGLKGYARIDWRLTDAGEPVFLEANPNPALSQDDDFAMAAKTAEYSYGELIAEIIGSALVSKAKDTKVAQRSS